MNVSSLQHITEEPEVNGRSPGETVPQTDQKLHDSSGTKAGYLMGGDERDVRKVWSE